MALDSLPQHDLSPSHVRALWQHRHTFTIFDTDFGDGRNFLKTWAAWQADPMRCQRLWVIACVPVGHALPHSQWLTEQDVSAPLAAQLHAACQSLTPGFHTLEFGQVTLMLCVGDLHRSVASLMCEADLLRLQANAWADGSLPPWLQRLPRLTKVGAKLMAPAAPDVAQAALQQMGFNADPSATWCATFQPRHVPPPPPGGAWANKPSHAMVIGAGLAGSVATQALCREGWRVTLIDAQPGPSLEASGNLGGMFHSILHGEDGIHARAHRAGALATWRQTRSWIEHGELNGDAKGLLRLDPKMDAAQASHLLAKLQLPPEHVEWLDQPSAQSTAGIAVPSSGWLFHQGGWLHPAGYVRKLLEAAHASAQGNEPVPTHLWGRTVARLVEQQGEWQALDEQGQLIAQAPYVVLANAHQTNALIDGLDATHACEPMPLSRVRGQISAIPSPAKQPHLPVAGSGYVLALPDGRLLFGATTQHHDADPAVRETDHRHNWRQAARLGALPPLADEAALPPELEGRTNWRALTPDRLPLIGALPWHHARLAEAPKRARWDQVRQLPRERQRHGGLFVLSGLGSRGITWTALSGQLLAHWMAGTPCPVEAELRDALDPARFLARSHRQ